MILVTFWIALGSWVAVCSLTRSRRPDHHDRAHRLRVRGCGAGPGGRHSSRGRARRCAGLMNLDGSAGALALADLCLEAHWSSETNRGGHVMTSHPEDGNREDRRNPAPAAKVWASCISRGQSGRRGEGGARRGTAVEHACTDRVPGRAGSRGAAGGAGCLPRPGACAHSVWADAWSHRLRALPRRWFRSWPRTFRGRRSRDFGCSCAATPTRRTSGCSAPPNGISCST